MSSTGKILTYGLIGGAGIYLATQVANTAQALSKIKVANAKISNVKLKAIGIDLTMQLDIQNPGSVNIPFEYYTGSIVHAKNKLAEFAFNGNGKNVILKARSVTPVVFTVAISTPAVIAKIVEIIKAISNNVKVDTLFIISGSVYAAGLDVPVTFTYDIRPGAVNGIAGLSEVGRFKLRKLSPLATVLNKFKKRKHSVRRSAIPLLTPASALPIQSSTASEPVVNTPVVEEVSGW